MEKVSKDKKVGGAKENITPAYNLDELKKNGVMDKRLEELVGGYNEMSGLYAKIQSFHSNELTHRKRFDEGLIEGGKVKVIKRPYKND